MSQIKIKEVKVITTQPAESRLVIVKIITPNQDFMAWDVRHLHSVFMQW